jgi:hypothetical protein
LPDYLVAYELGVGVKVFVSGLVFVPSYLNPLPGVIDNFNHKRQQVMIQVVSFPDTEKQLFFSVIQRFLGRSVIGVQHLQHLRTDNPSANHALMNFVFRGRKNSTFL